MKYIFYIMIVIVAQHLHAFDADATKELTALMKDIDKKIRVGKNDKAKVLVKNLVLPISNYANLNVIVKKRCATDYAILFQDLELLNACIMARVSLKKETLILAGNKGNIDILQMLIAYVCSRGLEDGILADLLSDVCVVDLKIRSKENICFPLYIELLNRGADPKAANEKGLQLLHLAAMGGNLPCARQCIEAGGDFKAKFEHEGALNIAIANKKVELAEYLLSHAAHSIEDPTEALVATMDMIYGMYKKFGNRWRQYKNIVFALIKEQIENGADIEAPNAKGETILQFLIHYNDDIAMVEFILKSGANANAGNTKNNWKVANYAYHKGDKKFIKLLLYYGMLRANFEPVSSEQFSAELAKKNVDELEQMLGAKNAVFNVVSIGAQSGQEIVEALSLLMGKYKETNCFDEKVNCKDKNGRSPLFIALTQRNKAAAKELIESGASINYPWRNGASVLYLVNTVPAFQDQKVLIFKKAIAEICCILAPLTLDPEKRVPYDKNKAQKVPFALLTDFVHRIAFWAVMSIAENGCPKKIEK